jgi:hypothetical protein
MVAVEELLKEIKAGKKIPKDTVVNESKFSEIRMCRRRCNTDLINVSGHQV